MFGYIFFFLTACFYIGLAMITASKPNLSGENAMGHGLALFFLGAGFALMSLALAISISVGGGFNWISQASGTRLLVVLLTWLVVALTTFCCAIFKWEWYNDTLYPEFLHWLAVRNGQLWLSLPWLVACALSLNTNWQVTASPYAFKLPFWFALCVGVVYSGGLLIGYLRESAKSAQTYAAEESAQRDRWHQQTLDEIAKQQPTDPIINLLGHANRFRDDDVRKAALEKIKAHPNWESEILDLLKDKRSYREVYDFLDGNRVEHPDQFAEPLNESILWLADNIKAEIKDSNNLQHWSFDMYGIDKVLRAIDDQFMNRGVDFYPSIVRLKQSLDTTPPERFKGVRFSIAGEVDRWLRSHRK
ncbi:hypothetical protein [Spirosoma aerolatum]|uniref:hypothetical protein n=1 Tax=Spirosoma aerolatum TaxID=1211326 RepID=UPI0009AD9F4F|nr:hypothetical protein [Spirosoma aerolatum]